MTLYCESTTVRVKRGDTWALVWSWLDADGNPIDLTGVSARMSFQVKDGDGSSVLDLSTDEGTLVIEAVSGTVAMAAPSTSTSGVSPDIYITDQELTFPTGVVLSTADVYFKVLEDRTI